MPQAEGLTLPFEGKDKIKKEFLETIEFREKPHLITYKTDEFSAVCPFSGLPDIATVIIKYIPNGKIVELKSLKYYLISYRNVGVYQEEMTSILFNHLKEVLSPKFLSVYTKYNIRGGIEAECYIETESEKEALKKYVHEGEK